MKIRLILTALVTASSFLLSLSVALAQTPPGKTNAQLNIAITGEPPTLDMHHSTVYITQYIGWHIFEGLFTLDKSYDAVPMLAESYTFDETNNAYTINLRKGVTFHDGSGFDADDVAASLERWGRKSNYGRIMFENIVEIRKTDPYVVEIKLKKASPVLPMMLAFPNQQAAIYPAEIVKKYGDGEVKEFIGTGPYKFVKHVADKQIHLTRYDNYAVSDKPVNGMGGKKTAHLKDLMFIPTPEVSVRLDGVASGLYDITDQISHDMEKMVRSYANIEATITKPYWWSMAVFNKSHAPFNDQKARMAFVLGIDPENVMRAAFASKEFYRLDPGILFQEQSKWWADVGKDVYLKRDVARAKVLLAESGYKGEKIRWLTTREYDFMYKNALVAAEQLKEIGFNIELQVLDWATIGQRRYQKDAYEIFSGATTFTPDPGVWPVFDSKWAGFWEDPVKDELLQKLNTTMDQAERYVVWKDMQQHFWDFAPLMKFGDFFILGVRAKNVKNYMATPFPYYWNTWKD